MKSILCVAVLMMSYVVYSQVALPLNVNGFPGGGELQSCSTSNGNLYYYDVDANRTVLRGWELGAKKVSTTSLEPIQEAINAFAASVNASKWSFTNLECVGKDVFVAYVYKNDTAAGVELFQVKQ